MEPKRKCSNRGNGSATSLSFKNLRHADDQPTSELIDRPTDGRGVYKIVTLSITVLGGVDGSEIFKITRKGIIHQ